MKEVTCVKKTTPEVLYDLIPSQQTMYLMFKYTFSKQIAQIATSFALEKDIDFDLLTKALSIEIQRNDSLLCSNLSPAFVNTGEI